MVNQKDNILADIQLEEDSRRQFKVSLDNIQQLAKEMCAMSNSRGGVIYLGVSDEENIVGISKEEQRKYNQWVSSAASEMIKPAIFPETNAVQIEGKRILIINISNGIANPYCDNQGKYWLKSGSDTRNASPQELARMFQASSQMTLDETPTKAKIEELDKAKFLTFFKKQTDQTLTETGLSVGQVLHNMNLMEDDCLTLAGLLLFGKQVQNYKPFCIIRAIAFPGMEISDDQFDDKQDCLGTLEEQYRASSNFLKRNLRRVQDQKSFNSVGIFEIDERAIEEVLVNSLLHRDYSKNAVIRLLVFRDRVEVISPGSLPNHLTVENIKAGNSVMRNPLLTSYGTKMMPYSGIGSGVPRVLKKEPNTIFLNEIEGEQFKVTFRRKNLR